jgi:abequosyltransferase
MMISICIPTYNRASELRRLLDSICEQCGYSLKLEIAISDNASTDDTEAMVASYIARGLNISYVRSSENRGYDSNVVKAVEIASGEFCWLFGSDDLMEPGAIAKVEHALITYPDLAGLSVGSQGYSSDLAHQVFVTDNVSTAFSQVTVLVGAEQVAERIGPWLGYMSGLIVRRTLWQAVISGASIASYMTGYIHLYISLRMLDAQSRWLVIPDRLVGCRVGNDSFDAKNEFSRARLDIVEFELVFGDSLGRNSPAYHHAMAMVAGFFVRSHFLSAKNRGVSRNYWRQAIPLSLRTYWRYPVYWTKIVPIIIAPQPLLRLAKRVHRRLHDPTKKQ